MRKIILGASIALFVFSSCKNNEPTAKTDDKAQMNLESARKVSSAFETGNASLLDNIVATDFVDHTERGDVVGPDSLKAMVNMMKTNFKDMKMETKREIADSEFVFQWMQYSGTSDGTMGMQKGPFNMSAVEVSKWKDGKMVEHWAFMDVIEMMKMMAPQPAGPMPMEDSTKMK